MKKRIFASLISLALASTMMAGCAKPPAEAPASSAAPNSAAPASSQNSSEMAMASTDAADFKVALMLPGALGDKSFFDAAFNAIEPIKTELGVTVDYIEVGADTTKHYPTFVDLCEKGYDLILTISSNGDDALLEAAKEYPDQKFVNLDSELADLPSNVYVIGTRNNEMCYLAGAAAALKAQELGETKIGFVGGMDIPGINEFLVGYIEGAQAIMPEIKVATSYVGSFTDSAKGKENGLLLYNSGVSVVFAAAGQSGLGVIGAAVEKGKFVVGVDSDQAMMLKDSNPEMANVILTSAIKMVSYNAVDAVKRTMEGTVAYGTRVVVGLKDGAVGIADNEFYQKLLSAEARAKIEEMKKGVISGATVITETKGLTTEQVNQIRDAVRP